MTPRRQRAWCGTAAGPPLVPEGDDLLEDILLRLPPQPSSLTRAAAVCKPWRRLVSESEFLRRYRARQRHPPLLGVFMNYSGYPIFQSTLDPPDAINPRRFLLYRCAGDSCDLLDVRHGRVLVFNRTRHQVVVWDPHTGDRRCVPEPPEFNDKEKVVFNGAVLCAAREEGHVHGDCHSSPFQVVLIAISRAQTWAFASVYSSETGVWGNLISMDNHHMMWDLSNSSILIGDCIYWLFDDIDEGILEFDLGRQRLSKIDPRPNMDNEGRHNYQIIVPEEGRIGLAILKVLSLDLWDMKVSCDGVGAWVLRKSVELEEITGLSRNERGQMIIHGYDEVDNVIYLRTDIGCIVVQLESMQFKNLGKRDFLTTCAYHPYRSFYSCKGFNLDHQMVWNDCIEAFREQKLTLQEVFNSTDCRFSLTTHTLTLNETMGYMCVTCHFINTDWKLQKRIIKVFVVETPHNGSEIFAALLSCIQDWNIEEKIFGITLGNSAANDVVAEMLRSSLVHKKVLPVEGKLLHNCCAAQIVNLIVNDALMFVDPIVGKVRESVKYIHSSRSRMQKIEEIVEQEGISRGDLPYLDSPTLWNSTYHMLEMALEVKSVFDSLALQDANYTYAPSFEEWERARAMCTLLEACYQATGAISYSSCRTSNLYFHEIWKIKLALDREASQVDNDVRKMVRGMQRKFKKYWIQSYISLSIPVIFDPRFKYMFVEFRLKQFFISEAGKRLKRVQKVLRGLFDEYSSESDDSSVDSTEDESEPEIDMEDDPLADWYQHLSKNSRVSTELDRYLDESPIHPSEDFDILKWWMVYAPMYPSLARIARDVLAMPMSTVSSKATFSTKERTINYFHRRLTTETTQALICLKDWSQASDPHRSIGLSTEINEHDEYSIESLCLSK